jgi:hypothetical protein
MARRRGLPRCIGDVELDPGGNLIAPTGTGREWYCKGLWDDPWCPVWSLSTRATWSSPSLWRPCEEDEADDASSSSSVAPGRSGRLGRLLLGSGSGLVHGLRPTGGLASSFSIFFSSIFSTFLFYNSILEFNYGLDDLDHMNILKLILGYYLG